MKTELYSAKDGIVYVNGKRFCKMFGYSKKNEQAKAEQLVKDFYKAETTAAECEKLFLATIEIQAIIEKLDEEEVR